MKTLTKSIILIATVICIISIAYLITDIPTINANNFQSQLLQLSKSKTINIEWCGNGPVTSWVPNDQISFYPCSSSMFLKTLISYTQGSTYNKDTNSFNRDGYYVPPIELGRQGNTFYACQETQIEMCCSF
jgi:hypothetical protein